MYLSVTLHLSPPSLILRLTLLHSLIHQDRVKGHSIIIHWLILYLHLRLLITVNIYYGLTPYRNTVFKKCFISDGSCSVNLRANIHRLCIQTEQLKPYFGKHGKLQVTVWVKKL